MVVSVGEVSSKLILDRLLSLRITVSNLKDIAEIECILKHNHFNSTFLPHGPHNVNFLIISCVPAQ